MLEFDTGVPVRKRRDYGSGEETVCLNRGYHAARRTVTGYDCPDCGCVMTGAMMRQFDDMRARMHTRALRAESAA